MRICLLGSLSSQRDEGMQNVNHYLWRELSKRHIVLCLDPRASRSRSFWRKIRLFQPEIIHYTSGPSILSLLLIKLLNISLPTSKTVVSALHPWFPGRSDFLIGMVRPHLVLVQSQATNALFRQRGCRTIFVPNGVDTLQFKPISQTEKLALRSEYDVPRNRYVILHVGSIKHERGIETLSEMQCSDQQVLAIGSLSTGYDQGVLDKLKQKGCWVWRKYFDNIEKLYNLADCYVFPTQDSLNAIEVPLSVLEAMACNLPVVSSTFGGLPDIFPEGEGLIYARSSAELVEGVQYIRKDSPLIRTRRKVLSMDWKKIVEQLEEAYRDAI
jgi:glycosyltransferase involved in cell wall biosynthesis